MINDSNSLNQKGTDETPDRDYFRQERREVEALIPGNARRILDVGCGEGILGKRLLGKEANEVVGIEVDPLACDRASENLSKVIQGDAELLELPFEDGYFDCIVFADVLEHMREPQTTLKRFYRYLADSGAIIASIPNVRYYGVINMLVEGHWKYRDYGILDKTHLRFFTRKEMDSLFNEAGFEVTGMTANIDPGYATLSDPLSGEISFGRVYLKGLSPEDLEDLFVMQYLVRGEKKKTGYKKVHDALNAAVGSGDLSRAVNLLEEHLELHPMVFEKNIEILKVQNPSLATAITTADIGDDLKLLTSKTGNPSLRVGHVTLHSFYDPVYEAGEWAEYQREKVERASAIIVLGFGLGYHIIELCNLELCRVSGMEIVVFEPRLDVLRKALELADLTSILTRIKLFAGDDIPPLHGVFTILEHKPSILISETYFSRLLPRLKVLQSMKRGLKIMVVGPIYGGSLPVAGYSASALKKLGHQVDYVDNSRYNNIFQVIPEITSEKTHQDHLRSMFISFLSEATIARCAEFKPDLVFALAQAPLTEESLRKLKENRIPTAFWFVEDFRFMNYWERIAPLYDYFFTIQRGQFFERLAEIDVRNFSYLPLAASPDSHKKVELKREEVDIYGGDISFVGAPYHNRKYFFTGLLDFDFKIWGDGWNVGLPLLRHVQRGGLWIDTEESVKIFNASKININLHSSTYHEGVNPYGDFVNPRTFEIAACGCFQLVDYRFEMSELFNIGKEIICFKDLNDARVKIRYFLNNPDERAEIAARGMERVLKEHTYSHRMEQMLEFILERGYELPSWNSRKEDVESLIEDAGRHTELGEYLAGLRDKGRISISDIVDEMASGVGELSRVDKIFVMISEIGKQFAKKD